jgi:uncharacterized protein YsxB (DUF464 family)
LIRIRFTNLSFDKGIGLKRGIDKISLTVEGHSGKGKKGEDLVCAAVSAIAQSALLGITRIAGLKQDFAVNDGFLKTEITISGISRRQREKLKIILDLFCIGIFEILKTNEGSVEIIFDDNEINA